MGKGKVYLVGAGPGDEKLITVRGLELVQKADVIVYDRLANPDLLNNKKESCQLIYVGKTAQNHSMKQADISNLLAEEAEKGNIVVRLKGGDPYVFGRGGEEGELLYDRKIEFEVVPGITSGIGGLTYAGIPITHRDYGSSLHLITGHKKNESSELDYSALARLDGTLVFYMGVENLPAIVEELLAHGKEEETKVALISWATYPHQRVIVTDLRELSRGELYETIKPPVLTVIGNVVELRDKLNFFEKRPLHGRRIIVTRASHQASTLSEQLKELGAKVIECPAIKISPVNLELLTKEIENLTDYTHLVFTSQNGVRIFMDEFIKYRDIRSLYPLKICSIGEATAKELSKYFIKADIMPEKYVAEELVKEIEKDMEDTDQKNVRILVPRASEARDVLIRALESNDRVKMIKELKIYRTDKEEISTQVREELSEGADAITFTSSSTATNFYEMIDQQIDACLSKAKIISIGPITTKTLTELGKNISKQAEKYTIDGVISALLDIL